MRLLDKLKEQISFGISNPALICRVGKNFISKALGGHPLRTVDITNTYQCNFKCAHCYVTHLKRNANQRKPLSFDQLKSIIDQCIKEGAFHFNIIGGEPTLDHNLKNLIGYIKKQKAIVSLTSNGSLLTLERLKELKEIGLDLLLLSMDGLGDQPNNFHGPPQKTGALKVITDCQKINLKFYISSVLTPNNIDSEETHQLINFCKDKKISLHINFPVLMGEWNARNDLFFTETDLKKAEDILRLPHIRSCEMSSYFQTKCSTGDEKLHITLYGDVMPCTFIPISYGNILEDDLPTIRTRIAQSHLLKIKSQYCLPSTSQEYKKIYCEKLSHQQLPVPHKKVFTEDLNILKNRHDD